MKHLIFYDSTCGLCDRLVRFVYKRDTKKQFYFAPLFGKTADQELKELPKELLDEDTFIFIEKWQEENKILSLGKGALAVLYRLGGIYTLPGLFSFLPSFLLDPPYRFIAARRKKWFPSPDCTLPKGDRFLP